MSINKQPPPLAIYDLVQVKYDRRYSTRFWHKKPEKMGSDYAIIHSSAWSFYDEYGVDVSALFMKKHPFTLSDIVEYKCLKKIGRTTFQTRVSYGLLISILNYKKISIWVDMKDLEKYSPLTGELEIRQRLWEKVNQDKS